MSYQDPLPAPRRRPYPAAKGTSQVPNGRGRVGSEHQSHGTNYKEAGYQGTGHLDGGFRNASLRNRRYGSMSYPSSSRRNTGAQAAVRATWFEGTGSADPGLRGTAARAAARSGAPPAAPWQPPDEEKIGGRGVIVGSVIGFLAAATALGVATLVSAFVRPQASPIIAVGGAFIDRTPPALKNFAVEHFGENDKNMLLLGMYVTIALIAMAIGILARRRTTIGVIGIAAFGLFGAFVAITRPESRATDVIPSIAGGVAGVVALVYLVNAGKLSAVRGRRS